jgi:hypothetical protein
VFAPSSSLLQSSGMNIQKLDDALTAFVTMIAPPDAQVSDKQALTVDNNPALAADVQGTNKDGSIAYVHVVVALPAANRLFALFAGGPIAHKDDIIGLVNAELPTVKLFEPSAAQSSATPTGAANEVALSAEQALPNTTYKYRLPTNWTTIPYGLAVILTPPDADLVTGPSITLIGGAQKDLFPNSRADATLDELLNDYVTTWLNYGNKAQVSNGRDVQVDGAMARAADVTWSTAKYEGFNGRLVIAQPGAGQVFVMIGGGTPEKAQSVLSIMDAMLAAVQFKQ